MSVRLNGSTSGYTELDAPAVAGNNTLKLPTGNGSAGQSMTTDGSGNLSFGSSIVSGTSQASTSGTSIDFTGIPSWAKQVTVMFSGVSTNGTSLVQVQLGATTFAVTGYTSGAQFGTTSQTSTTGLVVGFATAADVRYGSMIITNLSGNLWNEISSIYTTGSAVASGAGAVTLSGTLDRVRITTVNGTDQFDAGTINLLWE